MLLIGVAVWIEGEGENQAACSVRIYRKIFTGLRAIVGESAMMLLGRHASGLSISQGRSAGDD